MLQRCPQFSGLSRAYKQLFLGVLSGGWWFGRGHFRKQHAAVRRTRSRAEWLTAASEVPSFSPFNHWEREAQGAVCSNVQIELVKLHGSALALGASGDAAAVQAQDYRALPKIQKKYCFIITRLISFQQICIGKKKKPRISSL